MQGLRVYTQQEILAAMVRRVGRVSQWTTRAHHFACLGEELGIGSYLELSSYFESGQPDVGVRLRAEQSMAVAAVKELAGGWVDPKDDEIEDATGQGRR